MSASPLPADVRRLVIAARRVMDEEGGVDAFGDALSELDQAAEAFASRVPFDDEPEDGEAASAQAEAAAPAPDTAPRPQGIF